MGQQASSKKYRDDDGRQMGKDEFLEKILAFAPVTSPSPKPASDPNPEMNVQKNLETKLAESRKGAEESERTAFLSAINVICAAASNISRKKIFKNHKKSQKIFFLSVFYSQ